MVPYSSDLRNYIKEEALAIGYIYEKTMMGAKGCLF